MDIIAALRSEATRLEDQLGRVRSAIKCNERGQYEWHTEGCCTRRAQGRNLAPLGSYAAQALPGTEENLGREAQAEVTRRNRRARLFTPE